ncbi:glycosyl hydrolase%2C family 31 [Streptococcus pneumoniae]|nr:glycosyl hydrolase%2C family 31 [Streptococcus pneumoniae]
MIPYLYTMNVKTHEEGAPLISPIYYFYPENDESYNVPNQYFFGTELMVAPIVEKMDLTFQSAKVDVWFPEGEWTSRLRLCLQKVVQSFPWLVLR